MDRTELDAAVLSVTSPGTHCGDDAAARRLAREVNDAGAHRIIPAASACWRPAG